MPRNGSGVASQPPNTRGGPPNTPISSSKYNQVIDDIYQLFNEATPVTAGGTGSNTVSGARDNLGVDGKEVYTTRNADYELVKDDNNGTSRFTATATLTLTAAATLGVNWHHVVVSEVGVITIDPSGAETINGQSTLVVTSGNAVHISCDGSTFTARALDGIPRSANYTAVLADNGGKLNATAAITVALTAASTLGNGWKYRVIANNGDVTIDPNGTELINGQATLVVRSGTFVDVVCNGTIFTASLQASDLSPDFVQGLTLSNSGPDTNNYIGIASGTAKAGQKVVTNSGAFTKRLDANWSMGPGNGGLDTGSKANSATYRVWPLRNLSTGAFEAVLSLSTTVGGVTVPSGYEVVAPLGFDVGMIKTDGSGNIRAFSQSGIDFLLTTSQLDVNDATLGATAKTYQLTSLPTGRKIQAKIRPSFFDDAVAAVMITSLDETDQAPNQNGGPYTDINSVATGRGGTEKSVRTDTTAQIRVRAAGSSMPVTEFKIYTYGWTDYQVPRIG